MSKRVIVNTDKGCEIHDNVIKVTTKDILGGGFLVIETELYIMHININIIRSFVTKFSEETDS